MGKRYIDYHTIQHFLFGFICYLLFANTKMPFSYNFVISNGFHFLLEILENNKKPNGEILETTKNHIGDIIGFLLGWILAFRLKIDKHTPKIIIPGLWVLLIYAIIHEFGREKFPNDKNVFFKGAFLD